MIEQRRRVAANPQATPASGTRVSEERLFHRYAERSDLDARDELVTRFLPFARDLATRYSRGDEPLDDLVQVASIGLLKAVDRYDPERGTKFTSYAAPTILGELKPPTSLSRSARRSPGDGTSSLSSSGRSCTSVSSMSCPSARSASGSVTHRCTSRGSCGERWRGSR